MSNIQALNVKNKTLSLETQVSVSDKKTIAKLLGHALAGTYVLYHKTHSFHWNVTGPMFLSIHDLTEGQYKDLAKASDDIAERIRSLGLAAPTGLSNYVKESAIKDMDSLPTAGEMLHILANDHLKLADEFRKMAKQADDVDDIYTADMATARIGVHEKASWMLTALGAA
jgi:starvation-inducible DNA-binding protein